MRLYTSVTDLEYYNRYPELECYAEPVFAPTDIILQANGFTSLTLDFTLTIYVCDLSGTVSSDVTSNFIYNFRSIVIGGQTYYYCNIKGDTYSTYMETSRCFTLKVVITDSSGTIFTAWTQQYKILGTDPSYVPPTVLMDGALLEPCVPVDNPTLCVSNTGEYLKFQSAFDCYDSFTGDIYAEGELITAEGDPFLFERYFYIAARLRDIPSDITRIVSKNCRTQKTQYKPSYQFFGNVHIPVWKMRDIEGMFLANLMYIDGVQYENDGGVYMEQLGTPKNCEYIYKFSAIMTKCLQWQIFGCTPDCTSLASYYLFREPFSVLYDDKLAMIATTPEELKVYFDSITGVTAEELVMSLPCQYDTLMKVTGSGVLPKFIYVDNPIPSQRVYPKKLPLNTTNFNSLCNGVTVNNQVPIPDVTGTDSTDINVPVPDITGYDSVSANAETIQVTAGSGFTIQGTYTSATNYEGEGVLNLSLHTNTVSPYIDTVIATIGVEGRPINDMLITPADNGNMPVGSSLLIGANGDITYNGSATSSSGNDYYIELFMIRYSL